MRKLRDEVLVSYCEGVGGLHRLRCFKSLIQQGSKARVNDWIKDRYLKTLI